jgi:hypothetical protein
MGVVIKKRICNLKYDYKLAFFTKNSYRGVGIRRRMHSLR